MGTKERRRGLVVLGLGLKDTTGLLWGKNRALDTPQNEYGCRSSPLLIIPFPQSPVLFVSFV